MKQRIRVGTIELAYREYGDLASPPLVLLHALGPDSGYWDAVATALSDSFRVLALDQRGFGESDRPGEYGFELMRDDLHAFAGALGLERLSLIGHSMGGSVAFLFAERWPERVERMVIEDTPPPMGGRLPEPPEEPPARVQYHWPVARAIIRQLNNPDPAWWDDLARISCPVLVVGGGSTSPIPGEVLEQVVDRMPNARLATIEGGGHHVHVAKPVEFIALVREFLNEGS